MTVLRPIRFLVLAALAGCTGLRQWSGDVPTGDASNVAPADAPDVTPADAPDVTAADAPDVTAADAPDVTSGADTPSPDAPDAASIDAPETPSPDALDASADTAPDLGLDARDAASVDVPDVRVVFGDVLDAPAFGADAADVSFDRPDLIDAPAVAIDAPETSDGAGAPDVDPGALVAPRLRGPLSGAWVSTGRVTFRWYPVAGQEATVEVCGDPRCNTLSRIIHAGAGASATLSTSLAQGAHWWRVRPTQGGARGLYPSAVWSLVVEGRGTSSAAETGPQIDPDGDGRRDLFVSAWQARSGGGEVRAWLGGADLVQGGHRTLGGITRRGVGFGIAPAGDLNGDGWPDVIYSAMTSPYEPGEVIVLRGASGGYMPLTTSLNTGIDDASFGAAIAGLGDLDGDGYGDLAIGRPGYLSDADAVVMIYYGGASGFRGWNGTGRPLQGATLRGASTPAFAWGLALAGPGDLDGDGFADLVVGAPPRDGATGAGEVCVYRGGPSSLGSPLRIASPQPAPASFGGVVAGVGDVNGDGRADFAVRGGTRLEPRVYVFYGSPAGSSAVADVVLTPPAGTANFGSSIAGVGDVDRDGWADVAVGAPHGLAAGQVFVYRGGPSGLDPNAPYSLGSSEAATRFGQVIGRHGDVDGDGAPDLVVGDPLFDSAAGRVWVHRGAMGGPELLRWRMLHGAAADERFGHAL